MRALSREVQTTGPAIAAHLIGTYLLIVVFPLAIELEDGDWTDSIDNSSSWAR